MIKLTYNQWFQTITIGTVADYKEEFGTEPVDELATRVIWFEHGVHFVRNGHTYTVIIGNTIFETHSIHDAFTFLWENWIVIEYSDEIF